MLFITGSAVYGTLAAGFTTMDFHPGWVFVALVPRSPIVTIHVANMKVYAWFCKKDQRMTKLFRKTFDTSAITSNVCTYVCIGGRINACRGLHVRERKFIPMVISYVGWINGWIE